MYNHDALVKPWKDVRTYRRFMILQRVLAAKASPHTRPVSRRPVPPPTRTEPCAPFGIRPELYAEMFCEDSADESDRFDVSSLGSADDLDVPDVSPSPTARQVVDGRMHHAYQLPAWVREYYENIVDLDEQRRES